MLSWPAPPKSKKATYPRQDTFDALGCAGAVSPYLFLVVYPRLSHGAVWVDGTPKGHLMGS